MICIDEGTLIKGDTSQRSKAIHGLRARNQLLATGTPISNYVNQIFWLMWWCLGDSSLRFPYAYDGGLAAFESNFCVIEYIYGRQGSKSSTAGRSARYCHRSPTSAASGDGIPTGRLRRGVPIAGLAMRTTGEAVVAVLRRKVNLSEASVDHERAAERYAERLGHSRGALMKGGAGALVRLDDACRRA